jgi:NAD(P)-dependent dehydrogenase (short-subunit alcohol dehydrogenase family)
VRTDPEAFRYDGKRVLVVGGATGMGATAALTSALGAEAIVMDYAPIDYEAAAAIKIDFGPGLHRLALKQLSGTLDAVFSTAGIADGPPLMRFNFIGHRHLIDKLLADGRLGNDSSICPISSVAGIGWEADLGRLIEFLETPDYEAADAWVETHPDTNNYMFSKQAIKTYVGRQAPPLRRWGLAQAARGPGLGPYPSHKMLWNDEVSCPSRALVEAKQRATTRFNEEPTSSAFFSYGLGIYETLLVNRPTRNEAKTDLKSVRSPDRRRSRPPESPSSDAGSASRLFRSEFSCPPCALQE